MNAPTIRRGTKFIHNTWTDTNNVPLRCVVTAVRQGCVYWKEEGEEKSRAYFYRNEISRYVREVIA